MALPKIESTQVRPRHNPRAFQSDAQNCYGLPRGEKEIELQLSSPTVLETDPSLYIAR